jgi:hypothetical protein
VIASIARIDFVHNIPSRTYLALCCASQTHALAPAGEFDALFYDTELAGASMKDWKLMDTFQQWVGKSMAAPLQHIRDNKTNRHALQLSGYQFLAKKKIGLDVKALSVVMFHPTLDGYHEYPLRPLSAEIAAVAAVVRERVGASTVSAATAVPR